jgi:hypothetical protein
MTGKKFERAPVELADAVIDELERRGHAVQEFTLRDKHSNATLIAVVCDPTTHTFVGSIRGGRYYRTMAGSERQFVMATGESTTAEGAAREALAEWNGTLR